MTNSVSDLFDSTQWTVVPGFEDMTDVTYHQSADQGIARIAFNRPEVRNAFRPHTVDELYRALDDARLNPRLGVVLLTGLTDLRHEEIERAAHVGDVLLGTGQQRLLRHGPEVTRAGICGRTLSDTNHVSGLAFLAQSGRVSFTLAATGHCSS